MARTITDEEIKLEIRINGDEAKKKLFDLEKATRELKTTNEDLLAKKRILEISNKKETKEYKDLSAAIKSNKNTIDNYKAVMDGLREKIGVTALTMRQLQQEASRLRIAFINATPGTADHIKYEQELKKVNARIKQLREGVEKSRMTLGKLADGFNRYFGMFATLYTAFGDFALNIKSVIDLNGKYSDAQSDVQKTTGMTKKEVDELTKSFGALKTRTGTIDLLQIAEQGGRIGIAKAEIGSFVEVMNKANVALGDSFSGGVEEVANKLGKLKMLFQETKDMSVDQAYNSIGSAINELGANGVASEANITEFTTRLGSLPEALKPSVREALALGAAFEESGIEAEISARAYNIFMKQASTESKKFAKVMGMSTQAVENLINTNPLDFMMQFAQGLKGMNATEVAKTLSFLGINADGANKVIGAMSNNIGRFHELIDLSNSSFIEGTSLINEYNIKNNNLAATLDKISKKLAGMFTSEGFVGWLAGAVDWFARLIGATEDVDGKLKGLRNTLIYLVKFVTVATVSFLSYKSAVLLCALWTNKLKDALKLQYFQQLKNNAQTAISKGLYYAWAIIKALLTGRIKEATIAMRAFNIATKMNPIGFLVGLLVSAIAFFKLFGNETEKAAKKQETFGNLLKKAHSEADNSVVKTRTALSSLLSVIKEEGVAFEKKKRAYEEMIKIYPGFNGFLEKEKFNIQAITAVYEAYIKQLNAVARAKAFNALNEGNVARLLEAENKEYQAQKTLSHNEEMLRKLKDAERRRDKSYKVSVNGKDVTSKELEAVVSRSRKALEVQQNNLKNAAKIVQQTDDFRMSTIKRLQKEISSDEFWLNNIAKKGTFAYKETLAKVKANKEELALYLGESPTDGTPTKYTVPTDDGKDGKNRKRTDRELDARLKEELNAQKKLQELRNKNQADRIAQMAEGYEKEKQLEEHRYNEKIAGFKLQNEAVVQLQEEVSNELLKTALKVNETEAKQLQARKAQLTTKQTEINEALQFVDAEMQPEIIAQFQKQTEAIKAEQEQLENDLIAIVQEKFPIKADSIQKTQKLLLKQQAEYNRQSENEEDLHWLRMRTIQDKSVTDKVKRMEEDFQVSLTLAETHHLEEMKAFTGSQFEREQKEKQWQKQLIAIKTEALNQKLGILEEELASEYAAMIFMGKYNEEQIRRMEEAIANLKKARAELNAKNPNENDNGYTNNTADAFSRVFGGADVLGFTPAQWQETFTNLDTLQGRLQLANMGVSAMQSVWAQYSEYQKATETRSLSDYEKSMTSRKKKLKDQLDAGYLNQRQYKKQVEAIEDDYNKRKAELEYKQAKREKQIALIGAIMNTARAVTGALPNIVLSVIAGTMGALQIATIAKQPLPAKGYESGLYPDYVKREQDGKLFRASYGGKTKSGQVSRPTYFLTGENGPEMIIDSKAYSQFSPELRSALLREIRGIKGFENGYYRDGALFSGNSPQSAPSSDRPDDKLLVMMIGVIEKNTEMMKKLMDSPLTAFVSSRDMKSMKELKDGLKKYEELRNKNII